MNRDTAVKVLARLEAMFHEANGALHLVNNAGEEHEKGRFREVLGAVVASVDLDLLEPIYKQYPDLRPHGMDEIKG